jgi:hypothetical protein
MKHSRRFSPPTCSGPLGLVKQMAPAIRRVAMIYNPPTSPFAAYYLRPFEAAARAYGVQAIVELDASAGIGSGLSTRS